MAELLPGTAEGIAVAADLVAAGEVVAYPTETSYGLAVSAHDGSAVDRLLEVKGRAGDQPIGLIVASQAMFDPLVSDLPRLARGLIDRHWPGPLTIVLQSAVRLPAPLMSNGDEVGVRQSSHPIAQALCSAVGVPITATSANQSGKPPAMTAREAMLDGVAAVVGGQPGGGPASTVVRFVTDNRGKLIVDVLRQGPIKISLDE